MVISLLCNLQAKTPVLVYRHYVRIKVGVYNPSLSNTTHVSEKLTWTFLCFISDRHLVSPTFPHNLNVAWDASYVSLTSCATTAVIKMFIPHIVLHCTSYRCALIFCWSYHLETGQYISYSSTASNISVYCTTHCSENMCIRKSVYVQCATCNKGTNCNKMLLKICALKYANYTICPQIKTQSINIRCISHLHTKKTQNRNKKKN